MKPPPKIVFALGLCLLLMAGGYLILYNVNPKIMVGVILVSTGHLLLVGIEMGMLKDGIKKFLFAIAKLLAKSDEEDAISFPFKTGPLEESPSKQPTEDPFEDLPEKPKKYN